MNEAERIARLAAILGTARPGIVLGIGDDAAVLDAPEDPLVWSIDAAVEHVHFERAWLSPEDLGYRATMAALSDLAAMGARPLGVLAGLVLPPDLDEAWVDGIARGQRLACDELDTALIGGNLSRGSELSLTTTVLGAASRPMRRDRARAGDGVWIAGPVGLARAGLEALLGRGTGHRSALEAWRRPRARIAAGAVAAGVAEAAIDVSDGLARDALRLAEASDVAIVFDARALVEDDLREAARSIGVPPLELALHGGEDYALLVAAPHTVVSLPGFRRIGEARTSEPVDRAAGRRVAVSDGVTTTFVEPGGFDHFG